LLEKFQGALIGTLTGDALGMPVEGWTGERIRREHGVIDSMLEARLGAGTYTDDTEMMVALAETLCQNRCIDPVFLSKSLINNFNENRGYGVTTVIVLNFLRLNNNWEQAAFSHYPDGSMGNGACMRIAPVGVLFHDRPEELIKQATKSAELTHGHRLAIEGAKLQAMAVAGATMTPACQDIGAKFVEDLLKDIIEPEYKISLNKLLGLLSSPHDAEQITKILGSEMLALRSVPAAIYMFVRFNGDFKKIVSQAVSLGGDTDTVGAMAGAMAGAHLGLKSIPDEWFTMLENGAKGRDYIINLGEQLHNVWQLGKVG
tara:strand:+ start:17141 stop:18088 length:948 start_codon:yes stop_codon:yes gene_type:complete